jgi:hypothetical protein
MEAGFDETVDPMPQSSSKAWVESNASGLGADACASASKPSHVDGVCAFDASRRFCKFSILSFSAFAARSAIVSFAPFVVAPKEPASPLKASPNGPLFGGLELALWPAVEGVRGREVGADEPADDKRENTSGRGRDKLLVGGATEPSF